ncbi:MAG: hypothetical protein GY765_28605 [bacterium]|nr:hypothetical protein [bacterium]
MRTLVLLILVAVLCLALPASSLEERDKERGGDGNGKRSIKEIHSSAKNTNPAPILLETRDSAKHPQLKKKTAVSKVIDIKYSGTGVIFCQQTDIVSLAIYNTLMPGFFSGSPVCFN